MDRLVAKNGVKAMNAPLEENLIDEPYPIGVKFHMYRELIEAENENRVSNWA